AGVLRVEARAVVGDPQERAMPVRELDRDVLRSSVAARVRDRLADDADKRLALVGGDLCAVTHLDAELDADAARNLLGRLDERDFERLVHGPGQGSDRAPGLVEGAF